jgi:flagellar motor switch/type III secretory pathway protein FliN
MQSEEYKEVEEPVEEAIEIKMSDLLNLPLKEVLSLFKQKKKVYVHAEELDDKARSVIKEHSDNFIAKWRAATHNIDQEKLKELMELEIEISKRLGTYDLLVEKS